MSIGEWVFLAVVLGSISFGGVNAILWSRRVDRSLKHRESMMLNWDATEAIGRLQCQPTEAIKAPCESHLNGEWVINRPHPNLYCPVSTCELIEAERRDGTVIRVMAGNLATLDFGWGRTSVKPQASDIIRYRRWLPGYE